MNQQSKALTPAEKRRNTMIAKHGSIEAYREWQRKQGSRGGSNANPNNPSNFKNNKKLAAKAGTKGGKKSKRTKIATEPDHVQSRVATEV